MLALLAAAALAAAPPPAVAAPDAALGAQVDAAVAAVLKADQAPGASVAVVRGGRIVWARGYGLADVAKRTPATAATRFQIASVSKEFTAAALLLLQEDGKLTLDDPVGKWLPGLTEADHVTLRQVLTHTSGYSDYWPQDYVPPMFRRPTTPAAILDRWAKRPLDFRPGEDWQYSNTGYVIAGQVVEKAAGEPLFAFLQRRVFRPLGMAVGDIDTGRAEAADATGYERHALGPVVEAPRLGANWLYAAGEMSTTAADVARWDVSLLDRSLLKPASYVEEFTTARLKTGRDTGYALGLFVRERGGRREWEHGGEGAGFLAENRVFPDERAAIVVAVNSFSTDAQTDIADRIEALILPPKGPEAQARRVFAALQRGAPPREEMTPECAAWFDAAVTADYARSLGPLGAPVSFTAAGHASRGGMSFDSYRIHAGGKALRLTVYTTPEGKVDQFLVYDAG